MNVKDFRNTLYVRGAREHNLKNIDVSIPRDKITVITGPSGSGKSSLAMDTIYAEGQRRYVESLSAYARQFLEQMQKPELDYIDGLSPSIAIDQKTVTKSPRSTVGTITETYDYMRVLYTRIGIPYCYKCGAVIATQDINNIITAGICAARRHQDPGPGSSRKRKKGRIQEGTPSDEDRRICQGQD